jgi:hypothetical protein
MSTEAEGADTSYDDAASRSVGLPLADELAERSAGQALTVNWVCQLSEAKRVKPPYLS